MELSDIRVKQSDTEKCNDTNCYDNIALTNRSERQDESNKHEETNNDEGHYEHLRLDNKQNKTKEDKLKRLRCAVYILSALMLVLYIAVIVLIIFVVVIRSPVDGNWTNWSDWTACVISCGNGTKIRTRKCANPSPILGGANCVGESIQKDRCMKDSCPVTNGDWTNWGSWSVCSVTCGGGTKARSRSCTNLKSFDFADYCNGDPFQFQQCNLSTCSSKMSAFSVNRPSSYERIDGVSKLTFAHVIYHNGRDFNLSSGTFKCSIPGTYHFSVTLVKRRASSRVDWVYCDLIKSEQKLIYIKVDPTDDDTDKGNAAISQSVVTHLSVGDTVYLSGCTDPPNYHMESWSSFTGFILYPDN